MAAAVLMVVGFGATMWVVARAETMERLVAVELSTTVAVLVLLLLSQGFGRPTYTDLALTLALLSFAGSMVFVRFMERWL